jgi:hypothetical protein
MNNNKLRKFIGVGCQSSFQYDGVHGSHVCTHHQINLPTINIIGNFRHLNNKNIFLHYNIVGCIIHFLEKGSKEERRSV